MFEKPLLFQSTEQAEVSHCVPCATRLSLRYCDKHLHGKQVATELFEGHTAGIQDECHDMEILGIKLLEDCYRDKAILSSDFCPVL